MLPKPQGCQSCPLYGDGLGFVPDKLNDQAEVFIYGQNPGKDEEEGRMWDGQSYEACDPQPFTGKTGYELNRLLPVGGLDRPMLSVATPSDADLTIPTPYPRSHTK